jgi:Putative peptidoglycan binding domain
VIWAQGCLAQLLGIELPRDGLIGPDTQRAIGAFQAQRLLPSTGTLDENTVNGLRAECGDQQEAAFGGDAGAEFGEYDLDPSGIDLEGPHLEPGWPPGRRFNPGPPQIIPAGPYQTSLCQAVNDDHDELLFAVDELKSRLRQRPSNPTIVENRSDNVRALCRRIVARLRNHVFLPRGCTRHDLRAFAEAVAVMRGPGEDADTGSWPPASSRREREARRAARESLKHLLAWIRDEAQRMPPT